MLVYLSYKYFPPSFPLTIFLFSVISSILILSPYLHLHSHFFLSFINFLLPSHELLSFFSSFLPFIQYHTYFHYSLTHKLSIPSILLPSPPFPPSSFPSFLGKVKDTRVLRSSHPSTNLTWEDYCISLSLSLSLSLSIYLSLIHNVFFQI